MMAAHGGRAAACALLEARAHRGARALECGDFRARRPRRCSLTSMSSHLERRGRARPRSRGWQSPRRGRDATVDSRRVAGTRRRRAAPRLRACGSACAISATPAAAAASKPTMTISSPPRTPSDISATALRGIGAAAARADLEIMRQRLGEARDQRRGPRVDAVRMLDHHGLADHAARACARARGCASGRAELFELEQHVADCAARDRDARARPGSAPRLVTITGVIEAARPAARARRDRSSAAGRRRARDRPCARGSVKPSPPSATVSMPTCSSDLRAAGGAQRHGMARGGDRNHLAVAGRAQFVAGRIDGHALAQHGAREHLVGDLRERRCSSRRTARGWSTPRVSSRRARGCRSPTWDRSCCA